MEEKSNQAYEINVRKQFIELVREKRMESKHFFGRRGMYSPDGRCSLHNKQSEKHFIVPPRKKLSDLEKV